MADVTAPEFSSASIDTTGDETTVVFSENLNDTALGGGEFTLSCTTTGAIGLTYSSGDGTASWVFTNSATVQESGTDTCTVSFDGAANEAEDDAGNDLADFSTQAVTNNSTQGGSYTDTFADESAWSDPGTDFSVTGGYLQADTSDAEIFLLYTTDFGGSDQYQEAEFDAFSANDFPGFIFRVDAIDAAPDGLVVTYDVAYDRFQVWQIDDGGSVAQLGANCDYTLDAGDYVRVDVSGATNSSNIYVCDGGTSPVGVVCNDANDVCKWEALDTTTAGPTYGTYAGIYAYEADSIQYDNWEGYTK